MADVPSHRVLAMLRGEREALLSVHIVPPVVQAMAILEGIFVTGETEASQQVRLAVQDSYQRLLEASMEIEVRKEARVRAEDAAIKVFAGQSAGVASGPGPGAEATPGPRPRIPHRLQIGMPGPARPVAAPRYRLSPAGWTRRAGGGQDVPLGRRERVPRVGYPTAPS